MSKVTVYYFTDYNIVTDQIIRSKRMATFVWVKSLNYMPLMDTAKEVDISELDDDGLYPRKR